MTLPLSSVQTERSIQFLRHSLVNFLGQAIPMALAIVAIPATVSGLGVERFALLSLSWSLLAYFSYFDLGIGRATTNAVARRMADGSEQEAARLLNAAIFLNLVSSVAISVIVLGLSPTVQEILGLTGDLKSEMHGMMIALAMAIPVLTVGGTFRAALEGLQRFTSVNIIKSIFNGFLFLMPLLGVWSGWSLPEITWAIVLSRLFMAISYWWLARSRFPRTVGFIPSISSVKELLVYGGWVSLTNILTPLLGFGERFIIPALLSVGILTYYTAPYEMISRVAIIPFSVSLAAFPRISVAHSREESSLWRNLISEPLTLLQVILVPVVVVVVLFSPEILDAWLGPSFRAKSSGLLRWLAVGFYFNSVAYVMLTAIQGMDRPDLTAAIYIGEVFLFFSLCWWWTRIAGLEGAALSKLALLATDAAAMTYVALRLIPQRNAAKDLRDLSRVLVPAILTLGAGLVLSGFLNSSYWKGTAVVVLLLTFAFSVRRPVLETSIFSVVAEFGFRDFVKRVVLPGRRRADGE